MSGGRRGNTVAMMFSSYDLPQTLHPLALSLLLIDLMELGNCECDLFGGPGVRRYLLDEFQRVPADPHL